jgi:cell division protein FtsB
MRVLALSLLLIVLALQYQLWVGDSGMREVWRLRREVAAQTAQNDVLKDRNRNLAAEVQDLKKGKSAIEERARTDLGMVGTNETFFQVAPKQLLTHSNNSNVVTAETTPDASTDAPATHNVATGRPTATNNSGLGLSAAH